MRGAGPPQSAGEGGPPSPVTSSRREPRRYCLCAFHGSLRLSQCLVGSEMSARLSL
jgi:hypothetical protein